LASANGAVAAAVPPGGLEGGLPEAPETWPGAVAAVFLSLSLSPLADFFDALDPERERAALAGCVAAVVVSVGADIVG